LNSRNRASDGRWLTSPGPEVPTGGRSSILGHPGERLRERDPAPTDVQPVMTWLAQVDRVSIQSAMAEVEVAFQLRSEVVSGRVAE